MPAALTQTTSWFEDALEPHFKSRQIKGRQTVASPGEPDRHAILVRTGLLGLFKQSGSGARRVVALRYPGEAIAPHEFDLRVEAMTDSEVIFGAVATFDAGICPRPEYRRLLERSLGIAYEWSSRDAADATSRVAHFLCEHAVRSGFIEDEQFALELTQSQIAEITAQTSVNVNRVLKNLVGNGFLRPRQGSRRYTADWDGLRQLGGFNDEYLDTTRS